MIHQTKNAELTSEQLRELDKFGQKINGLGANFAVFDRTGRLIQLWETGNHKSCLEELAGYALDALKKEPDRDSRIQDLPRVTRCGEKSHIITSVVGSNSNRDAVVVIDCNPEESGNLDAPHKAGLLNTMFAEMLELFTCSFIMESKVNDQIERVTTELTMVYEELVLLHKLSTNMHLTEADGNFLQMACDSLTDIVSVEGIAILLEKKIDGQKHLNLAAGSGLIDIDEHTAAVLHDRLLEELHLRNEALLDSDVDTPFKYDWPDNIRNIIVVPLYSKDKEKNNNKKTSCGNSNIIGLLVAINRLDKPDFDSTDAKLFTSVAAGCAVFVENGRLFKDLKDLFIGSLRALTNSIDAKDQYTRGHSERVAFISKWIADKLVEKGLLAETEVTKVYLTGLLHDIGKMGIEEAVLRKNGKLTEEERCCITTHPSVGASILSEIKQMREIVPGVLCHHEREDGKGYPNGIKSEQIPMVSKIIALADSFDAMTSKRTYRDALSVKQAIREIERGLGTQFDETVGKAFLESDIYKLWDIIQKGFSGVYEDSALSEFGTLAVGALIR